MLQRIFARQTSESEPAFYRRCARVFNDRATELLRTGRNPEVAAMLAVAYTRLAHEREREAVTR